MIVIPKRVFNYLNENFDLDNCYDIMLKPEQNNEINLVWRDTADIFATFYIDTIEKVLESKKWC